MERRQMDDMIKELLVTGLDKYEWGSLSAHQLLMLVRIINNMESVKKASTDVLAGLSIADNRAGVS